MDLYVLRHAKAERAVPGGDDARRPLTEKGQRDARRLGRWVREHELALDLVATSPYTRAHETATLVAQCGSALPLMIWDELVPGSTVAALMARLATLDPNAAVLVVGHDPLLSDLVSAAIGGGRVRLAKGALALIGQFSPESGGALEWLVTPGVIVPGP